jgi:hypothetical protein
VVPETLQKQPPRIFEFFEFDFRVVEPFAATNLRKRRAAKLFGKTRREMLENFLPFKNCTWVRKKLARIYKGITQI